MPFVEAFIRYRSHSYSCVLVPLEGDLRDKVLAMADRVPDDLLAEDGREDDPHCTLLFGLHDEDPQPVADLLSRFERPIRFALGPVTVFENPEHDVLKVSVASPDLLFLNALLRKNLPNTQTHSQYVPHVTLAYVKSGEGQKLARQLGRLDEEGQATTVVFSDPDKTHTSIQLGKPVTEATKYAVEQPAEFDRLLKAHADAVGEGQQDSTLTELAAHLHKVGHPYRRLYAAAAMRGTGAAEKMFQEGLRSAAKYIPLPALNVDGEKATGGPFKVHSASFGQNTPVLTLTTYPSAKGHPNADGIPVKVPVYSKADLKALTEELPEAHRRHLDDNLHRVLPDSHPKDWNDDRQQQAEQVMEKGMADTPVKAEEVDWRSPETTPEDVYAMHIEDRPVRYAGEGLPVHPDLQGFKIAGFLTHLAGDSRLSENGRKWAAEALAGNVGSLWPLNDELHDTGHPDAGKYRLLQAAADIHTDLMTGHALRSLGERTDAPLHHLRLAVNGHPDAHPVAVEAIDHAVKSLTEPPTEKKPDVGTVVQTTPPVTPQTKAAPVIDKVAEAKADILKSLDRHQIRMDRKGLATDALNPKVGDPERYAADMGEDYDPLPSPSTQTAPLPKRQTAGQRLMLLIAAVKARQKATATPKVTAPEAGYDVANRQPKPASEMYSGVDVPERYRSSPALSEFISAVRQVRSSNQEVRRQVMEQQFKKLRLKIEGVHDAIADAPHTASANTAAAVLHSGDLEKVRAAVALIGLQTNSPAFLMLHEDDAGPDLLHQWTVTGSAEKLRRRLDEAGLTHRTLVPTETGWSTLIFDPKGALMEKVAAFAQKEGVSLNTSKGVGEVIGDSPEAEGTKSSRQTYRQIIKAYERSLQNASVQQGQYAGRSGPNSNQPAVSQPPAYQHPPAGPAAPTGAAAPTLYPTGSF